MAGQSRAASKDPDFEYGEWLGKGFARDVDRACHVVWQNLQHNGLDALSDQCGRGSHRGEGGAIGFCCISGAHG